MGVISQLFRDFARLKPSLTGSPATVQQIETANDIYFASRIWYGGSPDELLQLYSGNNNTGKFWSSRPSAGKIRRIHVSVARDTVNKLAEISAGGYNFLTAEEGREKELQTWKEFEAREGIGAQLEQVARDVLLYGFGAWKIYFDDAGRVRATWKTYPECEIITGEGKKVKEVIFKTEASDGKNVVVEHYQPGKIWAECKTRSGGPVAAMSAPREYWAAKANECVWSGAFSLAVPVVLGYSARFPGHPEGIIAGKFDNYDFLDESVSKFVEHLRDAGIKTYIPDSMLTAGQLPNAFDNKFIKVAGSMKQNAVDEITTSAETIQYQAYQSAYLMALDLCLQGIISPSTLGIDTSKTENAEAQREKEKATIYSRNKIIKVLSDALTALAITVNAADQTARGVYSPDVLTVAFSSDFDEYASPDFASVVTTISKAGNLMSIEAKVEELWGASRSEEWKAEEVKRLKIEQGIITAEAPGVLDYE